MREAIRLCTQLDATSIYITDIIVKDFLFFLHMLFNYICQNRILLAHN